jgi:hypothetical protein
MFTARPSQFHTKACMPLPGMSGTSQSEHVVAGGGGGSWTLWLGGGGDRGRCGPVNH